MNSPFLLTSAPEAGPKSLQQWMKFQGARDPKVDHFVVSVGKNDDPNRLNFLGTADLFTMKLRGQPAVTYDFEFTRPAPAPKPVTPSLARPTAPTVNSSVIVMNAVVISQPAFYYFWNQPIGELQYADGDRISKVTEPENAKVTSESETTKAPPYWSGDDLFVPIGFRGNVSFAQIFQDEPTNKRYELINKGGSFLMGDVPFLFDSEKQVWYAGLADDISGALPSKPRNETPRTASLNLEIPKLKHVKRIYLLINTYWGDASKPSLEIRLKFASGKSYVKQLISNSDVRDYNAGGGYTTKISGSTRQVWGRSDDQGLIRDIVLDMQTIEVPSEFNGETFVSFSVVDTGSWLRQRAFVSGVTAQVGNVKRIAPPR